MREEMRGALFLALTRGSSRKKIGQDDACYRENAVTPLNLYGR